MDTTTELPARPVAFIDKVRIVLAAGIAALLMCTIGWQVVAPVDPDMAVSFTAGGRALWLAWPAILALSVVSALIGTVVAGPRLAEAGVFAAGVGLAALALRGGSMQTVLGYLGGTEAGTRRALMVRMGVDCLLWAAVLAACWVAVSMAWRWLWTERPDDDETTPTATNTTGPMSSHSPVNSRGAGLALIVTAVVALFVIWLTIARTPVSMVARGQVIASVLGGLFFGAMAGRYFTGVNDPRGYLLAPLLVAVVGYLLGYLQADMGWTKNFGGSYAILPTTPPHVLVRSLPIEFLAVGVAGALLGYWSGAKIEHAAGEE